MKVLIVEDDPVSALALRAALRPLLREDDVIVAANDGAEAFELVRRDDDIRLVISDWMMPRMDGLDLCSRIRGLADRPYTYVILLTTRSAREDRLRGLAAGADDFLAKPLDRVELAARITVARRILSMQEELRTQAAQLEAARSELERRNRQLAEQAITDGLTGLRNHRRFHEALEEAFERAARADLPLSVVMIDVDRFKDYNDSFGHPAGDEVLRAVARHLREQTRRHDEVARYGGEEFAALLPGADADAAMRLAERLRAAIAAGPWPHRQVTASFGVASRTERVRTASQLVSEADQALYRSKAAGRNQVSHHLDLRTRIA